MGFNGLKRWDMDNQHSDFQWDILWEDPDHFETPDKAHFETQRIRIISKHKSPG